MSSEADPVAAEPVQSAESSEEKVADSSAAKHDDQETSGEANATTTEPEAEAVANGSSTTPSSSAKKVKDTKKRSSTIPEHKSKKGAKAKKEVVLNLDCQPGDYYFARMKGHPEWPAIIADEEMLPDPILGSRPVTARRTDYTFREDYADGGKNVENRTYPVMFLGTNEFAWMVNSDLRKMEPEDVEDISKLKITKKGLTGAYQVARERPGLEHFKKILFGFEAARAEEERSYAEKQAAEEKKAAAKEKEKEEPKSKKGKRKSAATVDEDAMDVDDEEPEAAKPSKKRKKSGIESDGEEKPAKTPKIKLNATKPANGESASKTKPKAKTPKAKPAQAAAPVLSETEQKDKTEKSVLYLRHKLQKGFLQSKAPDESEMPAMATHFDTLQQYKVLDGDIIRVTKIHKVLKAILKLDVVPLDDKYGFKKQSSELLSGWNRVLAAESSGTADGASNGPKAEEATPVAKAEEATPVAMQEKKDDVAPTTETSTDDVDVTMEEAKRDEEAPAGATPAAPAEAEAS